MIRLILITALVFATGLNANAQKATVSELNDLLPDIGIKSIEAREQAQKKWENLCYPLGTPGNTEREAVCKSMAEMLNAPKTRMAAKQFIIKQLERIGGEEVVPTLATFVASEKGGLRDAARRALANNPSPSATTALIEQFEKAEKESEKRSLINAIGYRADKDATEFLTKTITENKGPILRSAVTALGRIGADTDSKLIRKGGDKDALLSAADQLAAQGNRKAALAIYRPLAKNLKDTPFGTAAFRGVLESSDGKNVVASILEAISGDHAPRRQIAMAKIRSLSVAEAEQIATDLDSMADDAKTAALIALGTRKTTSPKIATDVLQSAKSDNEQVQLAAIGALAGVGDGSAVPDLMQWLAAEGEVNAAANTVLRKMREPTLNKLLAEQFQASKSNQTRKQVLDILNGRRALDALPAFVAALADDDPEIQKSGYNALSRLGTANEIAAMMPPLLAAEGKQRDQAEKLLVGMCQRIPEGAEPVVAYFDAANNATKSQLMPLLGRIGGDSSLATIRRAIKSTDAKQSAAAINALTNWPDHTVASDLKDIAASSKDEGQTIRALRGLARVCVLGGEDAEKLDYLKFVLESATRDDEKVLALDRAKAIRTVESLNFVLPFVEAKEAIGDRACRTVIDLAHHRGLREPNRDVFEPALKKVQSLMKNKRQLERVRKYLANE